MTTHEAAWLAGFIDGEGSIMVLRSVRKNAPNCPRPFFDAAICACNTSLRLIERCSEIAGGYIIPVKKSTKNPRWKPAYHWRAKGKKVSEILIAILPFLVEKRRQAEIVLALKSTMHRGSKPGRFGTRLTDEEHAEKEAMWMEVKRLNQRGTTQAEIPS